MQDLDLKIKLVEISEALKYITKRLDQQEVEIKGLHRENAKQSEEIKDSVYLSETVRNKLEHFQQGCSDHKSIILSKDKDVKDLIKEHKVLIDGLNDSIDSLKDAINRVSNTKIIQVVQGITGALVILVVILGAILGWIKVG